MATPSTCCSLTKILKMLLALSYGQAEVERGFNVNSQLLVENLSSESLLLQRIVSDHINQNRLESCQLTITANLFKNVTCARSRYFAAQKERAQGNVKSKGQV